MELGGPNQDITIGSVFSSTLGQVLRKQDINTKNAQLIDIAYWSDSCMTSNGLKRCNYFISPFIADRDQKIDIPNANTSNHSYYANLLEYRNEFSFTVDDFDNMENDLPIEDINIFFSEPQYIWDEAQCPFIVLFQNEFTGKRGVLKITEFESGLDGRIRFDLKIQKYIYE